MLIFEIVIVGINLVNTAKPAIFLILSFVLALRFLSVIIDLIKYRRKQRAVRVTYFIYISKMLRK